MTNSYLWLRVQLFGLNPIESIYGFSKLILLTDYSLSPDNPVRVVILKLP
jgi:hypothetical protein